MTRIVFSKNRALQLQAFLRSYRDQVLPDAPIHVLYLATTPRHEAAYRAVFRQFPWVHPHPQTHFRADLLGLVPSDGWVILFADDHLFVRPWTEEEQPINLHLGLNLAHCYTRNLAQPIPVHRLVEPDKLTWRWGAGQLDWRYPLCPCGQVYDASEFKTMLSCLHFTSPNTLEASLQAFAPSFWDRLGVCYRQSKLVLLPWNLVQTDCVNRIADHYPTSDGLLEQWEAGYQVNMAPLYGVLNQSVHQALPLVLEPR